MWTDKSVITSSPQLSVWTTRVRNGAMKLEALWHSEFKVLQACQLSPAVKSNIQEASVERKQELKGHSHLLSQPAS